MKKLTQDEARKIVESYYLNTFSFSMRHGQWIFNKLPCDIRNEITGVQGKDFFYLEDGQQAIEMFYENCVEGGYQL